MPTDSCLRTAVRGRSTRPLALALVLLAATLPSAGRSAADEEPVNRRLAPPASRLNRPEAAPPFICGHVAFGGAFAHEHGQGGYGGSVIFHPPAAAEFLDFLLAWNTGLVLQADWLSLGGGGRVLSADLILRRYLSERARDGMAVQAFVGGGVGASSAWPGTDSGTPGLKYWSLLLEGGQEWRIARGHLFLLKGQLRLLQHGGVDWSTWSVMAGFGLPFPW